MNAYSVARSTLVVSILLFGSRGAKAACVIRGVRPTVPLPTMEFGQQFSFIASADCETLRFRVQGTTLSKIPTGPITGSSGPVYTVALTEREWNSVVDPTDTTFTWSIIGTTSAGVTTRVTTTNELDVAAPVTVDLSMADAKLVGEEASDYAGYSVSGAGDVNADGHDDVLVGAYRNDEGGDNAGAAYLVLGPVTGTLDLSLADAKLVGEWTAYTGDYAGYSVSGAGDVDADGHDDLLVGASYHAEGRTWGGAAYLVLGPVTGSLDLSLADATLAGEGGDQAGDSVSGAGDVDGDGHDDLLIGAGQLPGPAYLVLGPVTGTLDLSLADAELVHERFSSSNYNVDDTTVSGAGDVDGDGHDDLLLGATGNGRYAGAAYLVLGPVTGSLDLSLADAKLVGEHGGTGGGRDGPTGGDHAGIVSGAGDVDGDGHDDLLIGAYGEDEGGSDAGAAYLVLGPVTGTLDLSLADAKLGGEESGEVAGYSVSGAGDVDADGHDDLLVGAIGNDEGGSAAGAAYLVLGPVTGTLDLSLADARLVGEEGGDYAGYSVSGAGDVDGDGHDDLLVGAWRNSEGGTDAGAAYLVYGGGLF